MTNLDTTIEDGGYLYEVRPVDRATPQLGLSTAHLSALAYFTKAFEDVQKGWEKKISDEGLEHAHDFHLYALTVGVEGIPAAMVVNVDDFAQAYFIQQTGKAEDDK